VAANPGAWRWVRQRNDGKYYDQEDTFRRSRYAVGDLLWMKEKLIRLHEGQVAYAWDGRRATKWDGTDFRLVQWSETGWSRDWLPPRFMPRWASRLPLEVTGVGVERVQSISEADAIAEGILPPENLCQTLLGDAREVSGKVRPTARAHICKTDLWPGPVEQFAALWDSLHAKPKRARRNPYTGAREDCYVAYPWEDVRRQRTRPNGLVEYTVGNPWNWVITFEKIAKPGKDTP